MIQLHCLIYSLLLFLFTRSPIHGRGLFCKRNIDAGEMVIEYSGNVIRSILTDKREKYYDSKVSSVAFINICKRHIHGTFLWLVI